MTAVLYQEPYAASTRGDLWGTMSPYRRAHHMAPHRGTDWAPGDVPALAIADGIVVLKQWSSVLGNVVVLKHADGLFSGYCHLASMPKTPIGATVRRHTSLGANLGETGSAATGRHLHLTLSRTVQGVFVGTTIDPLAWILAHDTAAAPAAAKRTVRAQPGDSLSALADEHRIPLERIKALNPQVKGPAFVIRVGDEIRVA